MGDPAHHRRLAKEKRLGAIHELKAGRHSNVADLALKAVEQAIEAEVAKEGLHFHRRPRTAHTERREWLRRKHPELTAHFDALWGAYGDLGYDGLNGRRAREAVEAMEMIFRGLGTMGRQD